MLASPLRRTSHNLITTKMTTANEELEDLTPVGELPDMVAFNRGVAFARQQIELDAISKKSLDDIEKKSKEEARSLEIQLDEQLMSFLYYSFSRGYQITHLQN